MLKKNIGYTRRNASFNFKLVARLQGSLLMLESLFFLLCITISILSTIFTKAATTTVTRIFLSLSFL